MVVFGGQRKGKGGGGRSILEALTESVTSLLKKKAKQETT